MRVLLVGLLTLLAGCSDAPSLAPASDPGPEPTPVQEESNATRSPAPPANATQTITVDLASLSYDHELVRYELVANADLAVDLEARLNLYQNGFTPGCAAFAAKGDGSGPEAHLVGWQSDADVYLDVHAAGMHPTVVPDQFDGERPAVPKVEGSINGSFEMRNGTRLVIDAGGSSPSVFDAAPTGEGPEGVLELTIQGDAVLVEIDRRPLTCGVGTRDAEGGTGISTYLLDAEHDGRIAFETQEATTLIASEPSRFTGTITAAFLNETVAADDGVSLSAPRGGAAALRFDSWTAFKQPGWFMADAYWPSAATA